MAECTPTPGDVRSGDAREEKAWESLRAELGHWLAAPDVVRELDAVMHHHADRADAAEAEVERLRAGIEALRDRAARLGLDEAAEDANTLLAGSGEQPSERERAWLNADPDAAKQNLHTILDILGPDESRDPDAAPMSGEEVRWRPAPVAPDSADVRERVAMLVRLSRIADRAWEARRSDAGFQEDVERLTDAVLAVVGPSGKGQVDG